MKSSVENKSVEIIGKNCKRNYDKFTHKWFNGIKHKRKSYVCSLTLKCCGLNHTCDCFDGKGKLMFERRETHEEI